MLERIASFDPAYDKTDEGYGIHGVTLKMSVKGPKGAVTFVLFTNWQLPHIQEKHDKELNSEAYRILTKPLPVNLGYHRPFNPETDNPDHVMKDCPFLNGQDCTYDGSGLQAIKVFNIMLKEGSAGVWKELENRYKLYFEYEDD